MAKVAINGLGRIGRANLKIVMDTSGLDLVGANDLSADNVVYLLKYNTVYGRSEKSVEANDDGSLTNGEHRLTLLREEKSGAPAVEVVERGYHVRVHGRVHPVVKHEEHHPPTECPQRSNVRRGLGC